MTRQDFDALVRRVERRYQGRQPALERAVGRWVALGAVCLLSWLAFATGLGVLLFALGAFAEPPGGVVLILMGVPLVLYGVLQLLYVLRVEVDPPDGVLVAPGAAPRLESMLERLGRELRCRPFDEVRVTMDLNAAVRELPRLGLLGWPRTVLEIGLPLAQALSPSELEAVLAHEFVHFSARHARGAVRVYRLNRTWGNLFRRMQRPAGDSFVRFSRSAITKFVGWYWPRLHARTLVVSRQHEYHADRDAAAVAGGAALATALWRTEVLAPWLSARFWPALFDEAAERPEPPDDLAARLAAAIRTTPTPEDAALWADRGLARATEHDDTHPALLDRIKPLGLSADDLRRIGFPAAPRPSSAEAYLAEILPAVERELSDRWRLENLGPWRDRYRRAASGARRKAAAEARKVAPTPTPTPTPEEEVIELTPLPPDTPADAHDLWEAARATASHESLAAAVPLLKRVLDVDPNHDGAAVALGRHLVAEGDASAEAMLRRVVDRNDEDWVTPACEALQVLYRESGRPDRLREVRERLDRHEADLGASQRERMTVTAGDDFATHGLADDALDPLRALLAADPDVGTAWLARKELRFFPNRPLFVLAVRGSGSRWWSADASQEADLVRRLVPRVALPGRSLVVARRGAFQGVARRVAKVPGSEVFRRDPPRR